MNLLLELAAFGIWFPVLCIIESILLIWFVEEEWGGKALVSFLLFLIGLQFLAKVNVFGFIKENPLRVFEFLCAYFICGIIWSGVRFYFYLSKMKSYFPAIMTKWNSLDVEERTRRWVSEKEYISCELPTEYGSRPLEFASHIGRITFWAAYWPPSMIWTMINNPIKRFFNWLIRDIFIGAYRKMFETMIKV